MSTLSQVIVEIPIATTYQLSDSEAGSTSTESSQMSSSDTLGLIEAFPDSPIHSGDLSDDDLKSSFMIYAQGHDDSAEEGAENTINDDAGYWGITYEDADGGTSSGFDPNFTASPDISSVTDPDGYNTIANPYVPNPVSPGDSWLDAPRDFSSRPDVPAWYENFTTVGEDTVYDSARVEWGSGDNLPNPSQTSSDISAQTLETISSLMGSSS